MPRKCPPRLKELARLWLLVLLLMPVPGSAGDGYLPKKAYQGDLIVGWMAASGTLTVNGQTHPVGASGRFAIGISRDQKTDIRVCMSTLGRRNCHVIRVLKYEWPSQHIRGLPDTMVSPDKNGRARIQADNRRVQSVRQNAFYPLGFFFDKGFIRPVNGPITGRFGTQRFLNGQARSSHSGVDIAAPRGTPVRCPADGIVRLAADDFFLMGKALMLDHGLGVVSIFIHLDRIDVDLGDMVRQGETLAAVGSSGRATGPHLHWGISVGATRIDPLRLLNRTFVADR